MHSSSKKEDISISYISALCADAGISYDIQRHDDDSTDGIIKNCHYADYTGAFRNAGGGRDLGRVEQGGITE